MYIDKLKKIFLIPLKILYYVQMYAKGHKMQSISVTCFNCLVCCGWPKLHIFTMDLDKIFEQKFEAKNYE